MNKDIIGGEYNKASFLKHKFWLKCTLSGVTKGALSVNAR